MRTKGSINQSKYKWEILMFDKENGSFKQGKYSTITELNKDLELNISNDLAWRLITQHRVDSDKKFKDKSFVSKYQHIKLSKIDEIRNPEK
jgi:hypothetical protein